MPADDAPLEWMVALLRYEWRNDPLRLSYTRTMHVHTKATAAERAHFYRTLLKIDWLPQRVRHAIMHEMGISPRAKRRTSLTRELRPFAC